MVSLLNISYPCRTPCARKIIMNPSPLTHGGSPGVGDRQATRLPRTWWPAPLRDPAGPRILTARARAWWMIWSWWGSYHIWWLFFILRCLHIESRHKSSHFLIASQAWSPLEGWNSDRRTTWWIGWYRRIVRSYPASLSMGFEPYKLAYTSHVAKWDTHPAIRVEPAANVRGFHSFAKDLDRWCLG